MLENKLRAAIQASEAGDLKTLFSLLVDVTQQDPNNTVALFLVAYYFLKNGMEGLAYSFLDRCAKMDPNHDQTWNNFGLVCAKLHRNDEAEQCLRKAIELQPDTPAQLNNMALVCVNTGRPEEAIKYADKSLAIDQNQADVQETRGYAHLLLGNYPEGWAGYEKAVGNSKHRPRKPLKDEPYWDGTKGIRVLVTGEQGLGDEISFASVIPDMMQDTRLILECDERLVGLFRRSFPGLTVVGTRIQALAGQDRGWTAEIDAHCLIGSIAQYYRQKKEDFPGTPYLVPDPERCLQWRVLLDRLPGKKIGLAWNGGSFDTFAGRRSLALKQLAPLFSIPDVTWVSLEYKSPAKEIQETGFPIVHWPRATEALRVDGRAYGDYDDTLALISQLDMVVSVTTTAVDACGAIGKPCWVLVPEKPHWRYGLKGDTKDWYKSVRLFRQNGPWEGVINELGESLAKYLSGDRFQTTTGVHGLTKLDNPAGLQTRPDHPLSAGATAVKAAWSNRVHF